MKQDLENTIEALSGADDEIEPSDAKDLYRLDLGKYDSKSERPRPLLNDISSLNPVLYSTY